MENIREKAAEQGANFIHIEAGTGNFYEYSLLGTAYRCPSEAPSKAPQISQK